VREFIANGAKPNAVDEVGKTALHWACIVGGPDVLDVRILIDAGANMDAADSYKRTPMHVAAFFGRQPTVLGLVNAGANVDAIDRSGRTPLQLAKDNEHKECAKALAVRILADRVLTDIEWDVIPRESDIEWDVIPRESDIGHLLPIVMTRDGRDAAAKLVSRLPEEGRKALETAAMCLSRFVHHDVAEQILVRCV
jgi:hypothetical protein